MAPIAYGYISSSGNCSNPIMFQLSSGIQIIIDGQSNI